jgi:hypothetical protein
LALDFIALSPPKMSDKLKLVDVFLSRLFPETSTSWKLVGHCAARFSFFQGAAAGMKAAQKNAPQVVQHVEA